MRINKSVKTVILLVLFAVCLISVALLETNNFYTANALETHETSSDVQYGIKQVRFNYTVQGSNGDLWNENMQKVGLTGQASSIYGFITDPRSTSPKSDSAFINVYSQNGYAANVLPNHFYVTDGYIGIDCVFMNKSVDYTGGIHTNYIEIFSDSSYTNSVERVDDFNSTKYFSLPDGTYYVKIVRTMYYFLVGDYGLNSATFSFTVDTNNPETTISHNGTTNWLQGGANTNGNILLSASDRNFEKWVYSYDATSSPSVSRIRYDYKNTNTAWTFANNKNTDGFKDGYYTFAVLDNATRLSSKFSCYLDRTSPTAESTVGNNGLTNKMLTVRAKDDGCGIKSIYYTKRDTKTACTLSKYDEKIDLNIHDKTKSYSVQIKNDGKFNGWYCFIIEDNVGNVSTPYYVEVDYTPYYVSVEKPMWVESVTLNWGTGTKTIYSSSDVVIPFGSTVNWSVTVKNGWSMGRNTGTFEMPRNNTTLSFEKPTQISGLSYTKSSNTSAIAIENHSILNRVTPANLPLYNSVTNFINSYAVVNNANAAANGLIKSKQNFEIGNAFYSRTESAYLVYRDATRNTSWQVLDSGFTSYSNKVFRIKKLTLDVGGVYELYMIARDENETLYRGEKITLVLEKQYKPTFGNQFNVSNTATNLNVNKYWSVTFSENNYSGTKAEIGIWNFDNYAAALAFAVSNEEKLVLQQNGKLLYRTEANHSVQYDYGSASLDSTKKKVAAVVERWAKERIAGDPETPTQYLRYNNALIGDRVWTEFNEINIGNNTCFVSQRLIKSLPTAYQSYNVYTLQSNFSFAAKEDISRSIFANTVTISAQFLQSNGTWGSSFEVVNTSKNTYSGSIQNRGQGFYLITEQDVIGNIERYIVYLDKEAPSIKAVQMSIVNGEEEYKDLTLNELWFDKYMSTARFIGLRLVSFFDNDSYCVLEINGRNIDGKRYVIGDALPDLTYENGYYGTYTLSAYDRTGNKRDYVVNIAGAPTQVTHTSLTNEVRCKISIDILDQTNELIDLKIQKSIYFEGGVDNQKLVDITVDNLGNQVNVLNLEYTFTEGGKYILTFRDIYGRQEMYEIFYLKGLPQAELVGVKVGGTTKDDVSCIYDDVETAILYKETESGWVVVNDVYTYDTGNNTRTTTITATSGEYTTYKFLVYVTADRNLFSEYKFKIKKRLPTVTVKDVDGNDVELNGITNKQFTIDWDDRDVHVDYSRSANKFNTTRYYRGEIFGTRVGTYYFDVSDSVGNTTSFSITFDNAVDYTIKGNYKLINGEIWSRRPITINPGEELTLYSCVSDSGESQQMGAALEIDGRYTIDIADVAGNVVNLVVVIDTTAPSPTVTKIDGTEAAINKSINTAFTVAFNEECTVKYSNNLESNVAYTGQELNVVGKYTFIATDLLGNTMTFTVTIDNEVLFKVDGTYVVVNGVYKSRFWLQLTSDEVITAVVTESNTGIDVKLNEKINVEGEYSVTLTDDAGNSVVIYLAIDFTPAEVVIETDTGEKLQENVSTNKAFIVKAVEEDSVIEYSENGKNYVLYFGGYLRTQGKHYFRITDNVGNVKEFTVLIDLDVVFTVKGNFVIIDGVYTSKDWLQLASDEVITAILTVSDTGIDVKLNERINVEGKYTVTLTDYAGNSTVIYLEIDFTPADAKVSTVNGDSVEMNGSTNAAFVVNSIEENAQLLYSQNNRDYKVYDGFVIDVGGLYYFKTVDAVGNEKVFTVMLDLQVNFTVLGSYVLVDNVYVSKDWLQLTSDEVITAVVTESNTGIDVKLNEKINVEGEYSVTLTDDAGNSVVIYLAIDTTAPIVVVRSENGDIVTQNGATNQNVTVTCDEVGAEIRVSKDGRNWNTYDNGLLENVGKYYFEISDIVGNVTAFAITIDKTVDYAIRGDYNVVNGAYISNTSLMILAQEDFGQFTVQSSNGVSFNLNERVYDEGEYIVSITDVVGNAVSLRLVIDKTPPKIDLTGVQHKGKTKTDVHVIMLGYANATITENGAREQITGQEFDVTKEGIYTIEASDDAGNSAAVTFEIDKSVQLTTNLLFCDNQILTDDVVIEMKESGAMKVLKDDVETDAPKGAFTVAGKYEVTLTDSLGNEIVYRFTLLDKSVKEFEYRLPNDIKVKVKEDPSAVKDGVITITQTGNYTLEFSKDGYTWTSLLEVRNSPPEIDVVQDGNYYVLKNTTPYNLTVSLVRNGKTYNYSFGDTLTENGNYVATITDEFGNVNEYQFSINYVNGWGIAVITIVAAGVAALAIVITVTRLRKRVR